MPRYACHKLISPLHHENGLYMQMVELDSCGFFRSWRPMTGEIRQTVWLGGICVLLPENIIPECGETLRDVSERSRQEDALSHPLCLWKLNGMPVDMSDTHPVEQWVKIGRPDDNG